MNHCYLNNNSFLYYVNDNMYVGRKMKGKTKKLVMALGMAGIVFLAIFVITTQYQISELSSIKEGGLPLSVKIFSDRSEGVAPIEINFSSIVTNNEGEISYHWDFGNGNTSTEWKSKTAYATNGTYTCNLDIEDASGKKASDSIKITAIENRPPTVSIEYVTKKPRRPQNFLIEFVLENFLAENIIYIENHGSQDYRWLRDRGYLEIIFKDQSFYTLEAISNDPDGDEIVSYDWTLNAPSYTTRLTNQPKDPTYTYSGKIIDIPTEDIYPATDYSITLTVTDSAGKTRSESLDFKVKKSQIKDNIEGIRKTIQNLITEWRSQYKDSAFMGGIGKLLFGFVTLKLLSKTPLGQLIAVIVIDTVLQTPPEEYTDGEYDSYIGPLKELTGKRTWAFNFLNKTTLWLQENTPAGAQQFARFFGAIDMEDLREYLEFENKRPEVTYPSPLNGEKNVDLNKPNLWVNVTDFEGDRFNVSIYSGYVNTTNHYKNYTNVTSSSFSAPLLPLPPSETIEWNVTIEELDCPEEKFTVYYEFTTDYE